MRFRNTNQLGRGRFLRALWRDTRALVRQFRTSLIAFAVLLSVGTLALRLLYVHPETARSLGWTEALHATFMLVFLETVLPLPATLGIQLLFIVIPVVGLGVARG